MEDYVKQGFVEAGIDVDDCLNRLLNKDDLFFRFMKKYLEDDNLELLKKAIDENNVSDAFKAAHTLKGVAGNLSFASILETLVPFVEVLRAGSMEGAEEAYEKISAAHEKIVAQIHTLD